MNESTDEAQITTDVAVIRAAMREIDEGRGAEAGEFFDQLRARLLALVPRAKRKPSERRAR